MKSITNYSEIDNNESSESSEFTMKDNENLKDFQSENEFVNNQDSENFKNYLPSNYELSQNLLGVESTINRRQLQSFIPYSKCHKLYQKDKMTNF